MLEAVLTNAVSQTASMTLVAGLHERSAFLAKVSAEVQALQQKHVVPALC